MSSTNLPFNITLLDLTPEKLARLKPVTSTDVFDGATKNFHDEGLFSFSIFGKVGSEQRNSLFSYINIKIDIIHPVVFNTLLKLRAFYLDIITGKQYAKWNDEIKDFEKTTPLEGNTGYAFFMEHWMNIVFEERPSTQREQGIKLIYDFKKKALINNVVVAPAGFREYEITGDGREADNEINNFYRKILSLTRSITNETIKNNPEILNTVRYSLQNTVNQLYDLFENMIQGKKKFIQDKWASRKVYNGTRNVITVMNVKTKDLGDSSNPSFNSSVVGIYQFIKAALPKCLYWLSTGFLSQVFTDVKAPAVLVNAKTLKKEYVNLKSSYYDLWMTNEGLSKVINSFKVETIRHKPLSIGGYHLGLIYKGEFNNKPFFKVFQDIDDVPDHLDRKLVTPITFCELLHLSIYKQANTIPAYMTRYPVAGMGSVYPSMTYMKTTIQDEVRYEADENWQVNDSSNVCHNFPITGASFVNSLSPHSSKLAGLTADFDGDTMSYNAVYSDEVIDEIKNFLNSSRFYVNSDNKMNHSMATDTAVYIMQNMTGK
jgi:hypothetical protein